MSESLTNQIVSFVERVVGAMGRLVNGHLGQVGDGVDRLAVDRDDAQGRLEAVGAAGGQPDDWRMGRPEQDDPPDAFPGRPQRGEGRAGDRTGEGVARVRGDQRLRPARSRGLGRVDQRPDGPAEPSRFGRVEAAGDGGGADDHRGGPVRD